MKNWWESKAIIGGIISIISMMVGTQLDPETAASITNQVITVLGVAVSMYGRIVAQDTIKGLFED